MIQIEIGHFSFYICFCRVYSAQADDMYRKGLTIRFGKYVYDLGKGWRNWTKDK